MAVETEPLWVELECSSCGACVEVHARETWNGLCPECDRCVDCDWHD